ncbi:MAG: DUF4302 domain-containing protein, partial [Bacteroidales bacterium]|nr:DUF4302 domain-containing protein [Bacteroidales bacterium]
MKKHIIRYFLPMLLLMGACQNNEVDKVFVDSPEERTNKKVEEMSANLINSEYGWIADYYFGDSILNTPLKLQFKENERVVIESVFEGYEKKESNYKIKYAQQLDLTFDTYSVLAYLVEDTRAADFRWELESETEDSYKFISRADIYEGQSYFTITKAGANANELMAEQRKIHEVRKRLENDPKKSFFRNLRVEGFRFGFRFDFNRYTDQMRLFGPFNGGDNYSYFVSKVDIKPDGKILLEEPLKIANKTITEFAYNADTDAFEITNNGVTGKIFYDTEPYSTRSGLSDFFLGFGFSYADAYGPKAGSLSEKMIAEVPGI